MLWKAIGSIKDSQLPIHFLGGWLFQSLGVSYMIKSKQGVTLLELLIVIVVLGVIASISVIYVGNIVENSRIKADQATVLRMNQATYYFSIGEANKVNEFIALEADEDRVSMLVDLGYLAQPPVAQHSDTVYVFDEEHLVWCNQSCSTILAEYIFTNTTFNLSEYEVKRNSNNISVTEEFIQVNPPQTVDEMLFIPNPRDSYRIDVVAQIQPPLSGWFGGFGVLFETKVNSSSLNDTGYIVQVDRHYGQIIVRKRDDGSDSGNHRILLRYNVVFNEGDVDYQFQDGNDTNGSSAVRNNPWWEEVHTLTLNVQHTGNNNKTLTVKIDGDHVFTWEIPDPIPVDEASLNFTGLRAWTDVPVKFYSLNISQ